MYRARGKFTCPRHPQYNPYRDAGELGIRGNCKFCQRILRVALAIEDAFKLMPPCDRPKKRPTPPDTRQAELFNEQHAGMWGYTTEQSLMQQGTPYPTIQKLKLR